jgi:hypothetical protein
LAVAWLERGEHRFTSGVPARPLRRPEEGPWC